MKNVEDYVNYDPASGLLTWKKSPYPKIRVGELVGWGNICGFLGVSTDDRRLPFRAKITVGGRCYDLGRYATAEEAHQEYLRAKRKYHAGCTI